MSEGLPIRQQSVIIPRPHAHLSPNQFILDTNGCDDIIWSAKARE